jgi:hypothetical protein
VKLGAGGSQLEPANAAIGRVERPPDEPGRLETVDVVGDGGTFEMDVGCEGRLADTAHIG